MNNFSTWSQSILLLAIRLIWGIQFLQTGWGKWHSIPKVTSFFTNIGIPFPMFNAYLVATVELAGGLLLVLGLCSRLASVPLMITMAVAYLTTEKEALHALPGNFDPFLSAVPFLFLFASLIVFVFGPGKLSLSGLLMRNSHPTEGKRLCLLE